MYDNNFLNLLRNKIPLSNIIGKNIKIINKGRYKIACCPFHKEKTPSFYINDEKGNYHCFGCGAHGDIISFVMQQENISFKEAIEKLANENNIELPKIDKNINNKKNDEIDIIYNINEKACEYFQKCIFEDAGKIGLNYIQNRGLNKENIKKFKIGFAPKGFNNLINYFKQFNFNEKQLEMAGLITKGNSGYYDKFRNRVMFPVLDKNGKVIAFTGRIINKEDIPKYMNSPETLIYHKSNVLFNYFFAKKSIGENKKAILVEGNLDAINLSINGIENVVAPMGTSITLTQIEELWKITDEIIVCLDGDIAGQKASLRLANLVLQILNPVKNIKFISLPQDQDPDDFIKLNGKTGFLEYIKDKNNCLSLSEFLWKNELDCLNFKQDKEYITPEEKSVLEININNIIKQINNKLVSKNFENFYKNQIFLISKYDGNKRAFNYRNLTKINYKKNIKPANSVDSLRDNIINIEKKIFCLIINYLNLIDQIFQIYNVDIFNIHYLDQDSDKIINIFLKIYEMNFADNKEILIDILEKNNFNNYINNSNMYNNILESKKVDLLYSLILERNINLIEIEIKNLSFENNNENKRKNMISELEFLQSKKNEIDEKF